MFMVFQLALDDDDDDDDDISIKPLNFKSSNSNFRVSVITNDLNKGEKPKLPPRFCSFETEGAESGHGRHSSQGSYGGHVSQGSYGGHSSQGSYGGQSGHGPVPVPAPAPVEEPEPIEDPEPESIENPEQEPEPESIENPEQEPEPEAVPEPILESEEFKALDTLNPDENKNLNIDEEFDKMLSEYDSINNKLQDMESIKADISISNSLKNFYEELGISPNSTIKENRDGQQHPESSEQTNINEE